MARVSLHLLLFITLSLVASITEGAVTCRDHDNKPVDWFIVYKLPVKFQSNKKWPFPPHLYMDSNNNNFQVSKQNLNETTQCLAYTLQQAYSNHKSQDMGYILYNDEKPIQAGGGYTESHGHTKGVTIFDQTSGLWLVHSIPKFPPPTNTSYMFADNAVYYGQHALCISLKSSDDVLKVGGQLMQNEPWVYDSNLPEALSETYPVMMEVVKGIKPAQVSRIVTLTSLAGIEFVSFAKSSKFNNDLYAALVAPNLKCNLSVETWQHGSSTDSNLASTCDTKYTVENVKGIEVPNHDIDFSNYFDHSKFAVCQSKAAGVSPVWTCIGDINRQTHQMVRGGGTVCFLNKVVNRQYLALIREVEECRQDNYS